MTLRQREELVEFHSVRTPKSYGAEFHAEWTLGESTYSPSPGTLDFFLVERYCLYSAHNGRLYRAKIHHHPWLLRSAKVNALRSSIIAAAGICEPQSPPLIQAQAEARHVEVWPPVPVD